MQLLITKYIEEKELSEEGIEQYIDSVYRMKEDGSFLTMCHDVFWQELKTVKCGMVWQMTMKKMEEKTLSSDFRC